MVWRPFMESPAVRAGTFLVVGLLLIVSLLGLYYASMAPAAVEVSTPVARYEQRGTFDYRVYLNPNSLFETTQLGPGQVYFARLVDDIRMQFAYELQADELVGEPEFTYQVSAILGAPGLWEKTFTLVPPTTTSDPPSTSFVLPVPQFLELIDTIREETQAATGTPRLTVRARVQPQAQSEHGPISEPFEHTTFFTFDDERITPSDDLVQTQAGTITEARVIPASSRNQIRQVSLLGLAFSLVLVIYVGWLYVQFRATVPTVEKELSQVKKRLKGLLVEADTVPPARDDHVVIEVHSLNDLVNMAEEAYLPVIYTPCESGVTYCVLAGSGAVRYQYTSAGEQHTTTTNGVVPPNNHHKYDERTVETDVEAT